MGDDNITTPEQDSGNLAGDQGSPPKDIPTPPKGQEPKGGKSVEDVQKELKETRAEAAARRVENRELKTRLDTLEGGLKQALGLKDESDPGDATKKIESLLKSLKSERIANQFMVAAAQHGADVELTRAVLQSKGEFDTMEPDKPGFAKAMEKLVAETMKENPKLKSNPTPQKSGSDFTGQPDGKVDMNSWLRSQARR